MKRGARGGRGGGWRAAEVKQQTINNIVSAPAADAMDYYETVELKVDSMLEEPLQIGNGDQVKEKRIWRGPADGKVHKRTKKTALQKNLRLKKYVQPKNAVVCLNELKPGITYNVEQSGAGCGAPTFVTVEVDGQKYRGFGSTKQLAKQAAAEAALISFVKPPPVSTAPGETSEEDKTPWAVLACFAMYKLFNEWREGRVGIMPPMMAPGMMQDPNLTQTLQALLSRQMQNVTPMEGVGPESSNHSNIALAAYLGKAHEEINTSNSEEFQRLNENSTLGIQSKQGVFSRLGFHSREGVFSRLGAKVLDAKSEEVKTVKPAKQLPENAHLLHPVMLLHQMRPSVQFSQSNSMKDGINIFTVVATVDNQTFVGEGQNVKKAKFDLAVKANQALYNVISSYVAPK